MSLIRCIATHGSHRKPGGLSKKERPRTNKTDIKREKLDPSNWEGHCCSDSCFMLRMGCLECIFGSGSAARIAEGLEETKTERRGDL